jgi:cell fate regulator YaaT (PSP1 superfamily)
MNSNTNQNIATVKIKFRGYRREYYLNSLEDPIVAEDALIVEADRGEDIGFAIAIAELNPNLVKEAGISLNVLRKASQFDLERDNENRIREKIAFQFCQKSIQEVNLPMKLVDVEYRFDRKKITFYFTADDRIDFRELVKVLASEYKTRIEMRQISSREELKRAKGIGACGLPLCCSEWLDNFDPISTQLVKEQNLPMNPTKISGCCGKLKCCFKYEHDTYAETLSKYPPYGTRLKSKDKIGILEKIDVFQQTMCIKFENDEIEEFPLKQFDHKIKVAEE